LITKEEIKEIVSATINEKNITKDFLKQRNLLDVDSEDYLVNNNSNSITAPRNDLENKPFVIFSSCPNPLLENLQVKNQEFQEWVDKNSTINLEEHSVILISKSKKNFDLGSITYNNDYNSRIGRYIEFFENGFVESGFGFPLIYGWKDERTFLNLCRTTGLFWAFLLFIKKFYDLHKYDGNLDIRICVHNSQSLTLTGFGGKLENGNIWLDPSGDWYDTSTPSTHRQNLEIRKSISIEELISKNILKIAREFSNKLSNVYGLESSKCYDYDGSFNFKNFTSIND